METDSIIGTRIVNDIPFGISQTDRLRHLFCIGKTGSGKSTLLRNLIVQDIEEGRGVSLLDPHGDLVEELLDYIPPWRTDDLIYINMSDDEHPVGLNVLENVGVKMEPVVAANIVATFKHLWGDSWGPRLEYVLYNAVAALLGVEKTTLLAVPRLLADPDYRRDLVPRIHDPKIRYFWEVEYPAFGRMLPEVISPIQNKVGQFLSSPVLRNILGQEQSTFSMQKAMDRKQIVFANLSKGRVGEHASNLLGSLIVTQVQHASLARAWVPQYEREPFHLYIDEFQNFTTDSFASILSESRKYGLGIVLANQFLGQIRDEVRSAVLGNVGNLITFRIGSTDASILSGEMECEPQTLCDLGRFEVRAKLTVDDDVQQAFTGRSEEPTGRFWGRGENLIEQSRMRFARQRDKVEQGLIM